MKNQIVESKTIVWCPNDDRHILIMKESDDIVGLNYIQGNELRYVGSTFTQADLELTDFFNAIEPYLVHDNEVDKINAAIWAFFEFRNLQDGRKAL